MSKRRKRHSNLRDGILEKTIKLIAKYGFSNVSFRRIATQLGVSQSAVMHHFPNRSELLRGVLEKVQRNNHEMVDSSFEIQDGSRERLRKHLGGNVNWALRCPAEMQVVMYLYYVGAYEKDYSILYKEALLEARKRIRALILAGKREGKVPPELDDELFAELVHDQLVGIVVNLLSIQNLSPKSAYLRRKLDNVVDMVFRC